MNRRKRSGKKGVEKFDYFLPRTGMSGRFVAKNGTCHARGMKMLLGKGLQYLLTMEHLAPLGMSL